jgi:multidrug resistance efflux pump
MKTAKRSQRIAWSVGLAALAVSAAGGFCAFNPGLVGKGGRATAQVAAEPNHSRLVCYGLVDVDFGVLSLYPLQAGRVVEVLARENQLVKQGTPLLKLDDRLAQIRVRQAQADHAAAVAQLAQARQLPKQYEAKLQQQKAALSAAEADAKAAQFILDRKKQLEKDRLANPLEVSASAELVTKARAAVSAEQGKLTELGLVDPQQQVARAEADEQAKKAQLDQAQFALAECTLLAPADGQVLQVLIGPGNVAPADPRQPAVMFCPTGPRIVRADIEQEFAGRISVGQTVTVEDEYGRGTPQTGKVTRVAEWYARPRSQSADPLKAMTSDVRTLECVIALDPSQGHFRLGQRVRVKAGN